MTWFFRDRSRSRGYRGFAAAQEYRLGLSAVTRIIRATQQKLIHSNQGNAHG